MKEYFISNHPRGKILWMWDNKMIYRWSRKRWLPHSMKGGLKALRYGAEGIASRQITNPNLISFYRAIL